ncbi:nuclear transport factor 2 family protein [Micromonospora mirobrigensis]|uniref:Ketosteroid isomerase-related protein n=1 Tax=Micromonospora mirobrigensis TaxID=262898 RepID=A0A1C4Z3T9_9ACTN|nr:nuclear transport factor 2 family protein [Micromonospora mirobrigensis]SCF27557.1 Ketosteroid isomerase-related protein [Micromonospora mirobrigensis]
MRSARELMVAYTATIADPDATAALFADDGVIELPYVSSIGRPPRIAGPDEIRAFIVGLLEMVPDFGFDHVEVFIDTPDQAFGEYSVERRTVTGRPFSQLYAGRLVAANGKIQLLRESLDLVRAARAVLPGGVADIPA